MFPIQDKGPQTRYSNTRKPDSISAIVEKTVCAGGARIKHEARISEECLEKK